MQMGSPGTMHALKRQAYEGAALFKIKVERQSSDILIMSFRTFPGPGRQRAKAQSTILPISGYQADGKWRWLWSRDAVREKIVPIDEANDEGKRQCVFGSYLLKR